jgi:hypothetical protein
VEGDAGRAPASQGCRDVPVGADAMFGRGVRRVCCCRRVDRPASPGAPAYHWYANIQKQFVYRHVAGHGFVVIPRRDR